MQEIRKHVTVLTVAYFLLFNPLALAMQSKQTQEDARAFLAKHRVTDSDEEDAQCTDKKDFAWHFNQSRKRHLDRDTQDAVPMEDDTDEKEDENAEVTDSVEVLSQKLLAAIKKGNTRTAQRLIAQKADVNYRNAYDAYDPRKKSDNIVSFSEIDNTPRRTEQMAYIARKHNSSDWTPLMFAIHPHSTNSDRTRSMPVRHPALNLTFVYKLLEAKAHVDDYSPNGCSALHILMDKSKDDGCRHRKSTNTEAAIQMLIVEGARLHSAAQKQEMHLASCRHDLPCPNYSWVKANAMAHTAKERETYQLTLPSLFRQPDFLLRETPEEVLPEDESRVNNAEKECQVATAHCLPHTLIESIITFLTTESFSSRKPLT